MKATPLVTLALLGLSFFGTRAAHAVPTPARGNALYVGPTQTYTTIQAAILAASAGDVILVDPGPYPEFIVDRGVSIVATGTEFEVLESASTNPAILIQGIPATDQVTIIGAKIQHGSNFDAPAVRVENNAGAVRLHQLNVREAFDINGTTAHAAVEIVNTNTFWVHDSDVWTSVPKRAIRLGSTGLDETVNALEVTDSDGVVQNSKLLGYNAYDTETYGGDALRVLGNSSVWLVDDFYQSPTASILRGGDGTIGGNAVQMFAPKKNAGRITNCGRVQLQPGSGTMQNGGSYSINGDFGITGPFSERLPKGCNAFQYAETSVASSAVSIGSTIRVQFRSQGGGPFLAVASTNTRYSRVLRGFDGRSILDVFAPTVVAFTRGVLAPAVAQTYDIAVPFDTALIGTQLVLQSVTGPIGTNQDAMTFGSLVVLTP